MGICTSVYIPLFISFRIKLEYNSLIMIRAILFDMVGVLLFKKKGFIPKTKEELNAEKIEQLYNNVDDKKLLLDIKSKLGLTDKEIKKALAYIPEKYEKFEELWKLLPVLKKRYKLVVINNGNSLAEKYWRKKLILVFLMNL